MTVERPNPEPRGTAIRLLFRLPLLLHERGIDIVERLARAATGVEWVVLTTRGRRSGEPRSVVLDVTGCDPSGRTVYVMPADGRDAHWWRNCEADARVTVELRGERFAARARPAAPDEGAAAARAFVAAHPLYARVIGRSVGMVDSLFDRAPAVEGAFAAWPVMALDRVADGAAGAGQRA